MGKKYLFDKRGSLISEIQEIARTHSLYVILSDENIQYSVNSSTQVEPVEEDEEFLDGSVVLCTYNVTSTEEPTHLYHKMGASGSGNGEDVEVFTSMKIDGIEQQEIVDYYTFNTIGKHKVLYTLTNPTDVGDFMFQECENIISIVLGNSIEKFSYNALEGVDTINSLTIGRAFNNDDLWVFMKDGLEYIKVHPDNQKYDSRNNCNAIIETSTNKLLLGSKNTIIPNSVTSIEQLAFQNCYGLTSIIIPDSVISIGRYAFGECHNLTSITLSNNLTTIDGWAFSGCTSLASIVVNSNNTKYDSRNNCNAIIETSTNTLISGCKNTMIPSSVTIIGKHAFNNHTNLKSIIIPNSITTIEDNAFSNCTDLTSINIPDSVTSINNGVFSSCTSLTSITLSNSITSISSSAFYNCSGLTSITIPDSVTSIGQEAFFSCTGLTSVIIGNSVTSIDSGAFALCSSLTLIKSYKMTAPAVYGPFFGIHVDGTLEIPSGATGYNSWLSNSSQYYLGYYNWTKVEK